MKRRSITLGLIARLIAWIVAAIWLATAFAISDHDATEARGFIQAVERWQTNPDFRAVTTEYVLKGSQAMRGRVLGMRGETAVLDFRLLPGLPPSLAASPGSDLHYRDFSRGALSAYLHLIGEQGIADNIPLIEQLGKHDPTDEEIRGFLNSFKLRDNIIATDVGAVEGVRRLIVDIDAARPLVVREDPTPKLLPHIASIARKSGAPEDPAQMTPDQQCQVYLALDHEVHQTDVELWRTKQVADLLCGIWGQAYGQTYAQVIGAALRVRAMARDTLPLAILLLLAVNLVGRRG